MRKLCLLLCIGLLSSMFHATAMPVVTIPLEQNDVTQSHLSHGCDEAPTSSDSKQCKIGAHICCLGIAAATSNKVTLNDTLTQSFNPIFKTLSLQIDPDQRFKPPQPSLEKLTLLAQNWAVFVD